MLFIVRKMRIIMMKYGKIDWFSGIVNSLTFFWQTRTKTYSNYISFCIQPECCDCLLTIALRCVHTTLKCVYKTHSSKRRVYNLVYLHMYKSHWLFWNAMFIRKYTETQHVLNKEIIWLLSMGEMLIDSNIHEDILD